MKREIDTLLHWSAVLLAGMVLAACGSTGSNGSSGGGPPEVVVVGESEEAPSDDHSVEEILTKYIRSTTRLDGRRVVQFDLRNSSSRSLAFAYRVEWLDRQGEPIRDPQSRWTHLVMAAEASAPVEIIAPNASAESWRLRATAEREAVPPE